MTLYFVWFSALKNLPQLRYAIVFSPVAVLGRGRGGLGPLTFCPASPSFSTDYLLLPPTRRSGARLPRLFWLELPLLLSLLWKKQQITKKQVFVSWECDEPQIYTDLQPLRQNYSIENDDKLLSYVVVQKHSMMVTIRPNINEFIGSRPMW